MGSLLRRGSLVLVFGQWAKYGLQFLSVILLARLLAPEAFGMMALVLSVSGIASVIGDFGLSLSALRTKVLSDEAQSALGWANGLLGSLVALICVVAAPFIAEAFGKDVVAPLLMFVSLTFVLNGFAVQNKVRLNRSGRFVALALLEIGSQLSGVVTAIVLAFSGAGVWSLAWQQVCASSCALVVVVLLTRWFPALPRRGTGVRSHLRFGSATFGTQVANYFSSNSDTIALGFAQSAAEVGFYNRAFQLSVLPVQQFAAPLTRAVVPGLARITSEAQLSASFKRVQASLYMIALPGLAFVIVEARFLVESLLGSPWLAAAVPLQVLAGASVFQILAYPVYWAAIIRARVGALFWSELPGRLVIIVGAFLAASIGNVAVAFVVLSGQAIIWTVAIVLAVPRLNLRRSEFLRPCLTPVALAGTVSVLLLLSSWFGLQRGWSSIVILLAGLTSVGAMMVILLCVPTIRRTIVAALAELRR
ncbi:lipopolysaccharide biosynthesis protein [Curtobacterium sp. TXMA1]|uniref:lipopolysaccharide biosynthesis protein n=1 Tax=Curtobacterium sp. TXMA1 TaxID=2876939 RepID=UPI001CCB1C57|nr:lipopolysaccharide biosynthesis protein [Curtobacterium sp. TXMA1]UBQ03090.1 lipopolysaccharide biosynthesis protein [Curtobacterium sp. TXMA1]